MKLRAVPQCSPRIIHIPYLNSAVAARPRSVVKMPVVHSRTSVSRPTSKSNIYSIKSKPTYIADNKNSISKPVVRPINKQKLLQPRSNMLRTAHDAILGKHADKIKSLHCRGRGRALVVLACGPSVNNAKIEALVGHPKIDIMCINKPEPKVWPSAYWMFCDQSQYNRNQEYWNTYNGMILNAASVRASHANQIIFRTISGKGFSRDMSKGFNIGRSTTYAAMQVSLYMDYDKIYIFGCDMAAVGLCLWRYGNNPDVAADNRLKRFEKEAEHFSWGTDTLSDFEKSKFVFCSLHNPFSFVKQYENIDEKTAHERILTFADGLMTKKELESSNINRI